MFLLDTNVVSELRKVRSGRADSNVAKWSGTIAAETMHLSVISIEEIEIGVLRAERRDPEQGKTLRSWLEHHVIPIFAERILPVDLDVVRRCVAVSVTNQPPHQDALIAATALVHKMTVVTRNVADFAPTGVPIINPWDEG